MLRVDRSRLAIPGRSARAAGRPGAGPAALLMLFATALSACASPTHRVEQGIDQAPIGRAGVMKLNDAAARPSPRRSAAPAGQAATASDSELHNELIRGMIAQDQFYAAVAHIQAQRVSSGDSTELRWLEGDARRRLGELSEAERLFNTLGDSAYAAHAQHGLGLIAARRRQEERALTHLTSAVALHPTAAEFRNDLGYAYLRAGQFDAALRQLATAAELAPDDPRIRNNLILLLLASGDTQRARAMADNSDVDAAGFARLQTQARQFTAATARRP